MSVEVSIAQNEFDGDAQSHAVNKVCRVSPENVSFFTQNANSVSSNGAYFIIPVSRNQLLSRRIILEMQVTLTVSQNGNTTSGIRHFGSCLRSDALNRIISNCQVRINGGPVTSQPYQYSELCQYYDRDLEELEYGSLQLGPNTPDYRAVENLNIYGQPSTIIAGAQTITPLNFQLNTNTTTLQTSTPGTLPTFTCAASTVTLSQGLYSFDQKLYSNTTSANTMDDRLYHFKSINATEKVLPSRGAYYSTVVGPTVTSGAGAVSVSKTYTVRYVLKNPILSNNSFDTLANVDNMDISLTFASDYQNRLVLMTVPYTELTTGGNTNATTAGVTTSVTFNQSVSNVRLLGHLYVPNSLDAVPSIQVVPSMTYNSNEFTIGAVNGGATSPNTITHPTIRIAQVPEAIFLSVPLDPGSRSPYISDYFAGISNLQILINRQPQSYIQYGVKDFYAMCARNGLKLKYQDFDYNVPTLLDGSTNTGPGAGFVILFKPSRDFSGALKENLNGSDFQIDIQYNVTNTLSGNYNFISRVLLVEGTTYIIEQGMPVTEVKGISQDEYERALADGKVLSIVPEELEKEYLGGGNFSDVLNKIKNGFKFISKPAAQLLSAAAPYLGKYGDKAGTAASVLNTVNGVLGGGAMGGSMLGGGGHHHGHHHMSRSEQLRHAGITL